jgi:predicted DNA binding protein
VPETELTWERSDAVDDDIRVLLWAAGGDFEEFEEALEDDPTVTVPLRTVEIGDRRLYQLELIDEGRETSVYPLLIEEGGLVHELTATHEGWEFRVGFPGREAFRRFHAFCRDHGIEIVLRQIYDQRGAPEDDGLRLTGPQREALLAAIDCGYFEIPRESSLADLADQLGVSENAASERLRRGMKRLTLHTLYTAVDTSD